MEKIRISAVKYANTYPFIYGLTESGFDKKAVLETDHPADCALKLINHRADIGLIPAASILQLTEYHIISNYCIGANGDVRTVLLLSNCPFDEIDTVYLDYRSRSSVNLAKVLAKNYWDREFRWMNTFRGFDFRNIGDNDSIILIGDQCFEYEKNYSYKIDLASEWKTFTGLPFVFACWTSNREIDDSFTGEFNEALSLGVGNIDKVVEKFEDTGTIKGENLRQYLTVNIDFNLDEAKREGLNLFLELLRKL